MNFIDHTGHVFSLKSYQSNPIGYEYDMNDYIFWIDSEYGTKLSVDNVYIKPIRIFTLTKASELNITLESNVFKVLGSSKIDENIRTLNNYTEYISIDETELINTLCIYDFYEPIEIETIASDDNQTPLQGYIYTFYVVGYTSDAGTWNSTGLIQIDNEYCPFTVGGQFYDESEELVINGKNMGILLPKDILKAIYQTPYENVYEDTVLYNDKIKEYLLNYMNIRGECGNYSSVINSIKWFGYGDKISISKLLQTDNEYMYQYIHDYFNIDDDIINSFKSFISSTYISLGIDFNKETGETYIQNFNNDFYGEGNPVLENLFDKDIIEHYDEGDIDFYRPYYRYCFNEMAMKITAMKYYLEKYFLPIYLSIHSAAIRHKAYTNDIKYLINSNIVYNEKPVLVYTGSSSKVTFPAEHNLYISNNRHYVDNKYNEFTDTYDKASRNLINAYYLHTSIIEIPLEFTTKDIKGEYIENGYYDVIIQLIKNDTCVFSEHTQFYQSEESKYKNFIVYPRNLSNHKDYKLSDWINDTYTLCVNVNGSWYYYEFTVLMPELDIHLGRLTYQYDDKFTQGSLIKEISTDKMIYTFNMFMWHPELTEDNNIKFIDEQVELWSDYNKDIFDIRTDDTFIKFLNLYKETMHFNNESKYYNRVLLFDLYNSEDNTVLQYSTTGDITSLYKEIGSWVLDPDRAFQYDTYLMHDDKQWYIICISKYTIEDVDKKYLSPENTNYNIDNKYKLVYNRATNRILVNRLKITWSNGHHHFNPNDIVICALANEDTLSVDMETQSKWFVEHMSVGMTEHSDISALGNIGILSTGDKNNAYEEGYYNISVNYNIDGTVNHNEKRQIKFFITKECKHSEILF